MPSSLNTLGPRQDGCHFPDDIFRCISLNENIWITINISLSFVPKGPIDNIPALVQIMAWRRSGDKPLSEPMMVSLLTHICVTRPQWVKSPIIPEDKGYDVTLENMFLRLGQTIPLFIKPYTKVCNLLVTDLIYSFIYLFFYLFIYLFIHSFIYLSIHSLIYIYKRTRLWTVGSPLH